jgi:hypothetical protein
MDTPDRVRERQFNNHGASAVGPELGLCSSAGVDEQTYPHSRMFVSVAGCGDQVLVGGMRGMGTGGFDN